MARTVQARAAGAVAGRPPVSRIAAAVGAVFLLIGILGFIPGVTTDYGDLQVVGHESGAHLLGLFRTSVLLNLVHLSFGVAGLALARTVAGARVFLVGGGAYYLLLWLYGLVVDHESTANFWPLNNFDDWFHLVAGFLLIGLGLIGRPRAGTRT
jgi:hypothetical protein